MFDRNFEEVHGDSEATATSYSQEILSSRLGLPTIPHVAPRRRCDEGGFTLIELLIVLVITPIIVGAISVALLATLRVQAGIRDRLSSSGDTQVMSSNFFKDVHDASMIFAPNMSSTPPQPAATAYPQCGNTGNAPILSLTWDNPAAVGFPSPSGQSTVVSYSIQNNGFLRPGVPQYELVRSYCSNVPTTPSPTSATPATSSSIVAGNVPPDLTAMLNQQLCQAGACTLAATAATTQFICMNSAIEGCSSTNTYDVTDVSMSVDPALSNPNNNNAPFSFTLDATPRASNAGGGDFGGGPSDVSPLELIATTGNTLNTCPSSNGGYHGLNINGPALFDGSQTAGPASISTSAVDYYLPSNQTLDKNVFIDNATLIFNQLSSPPLDPLSGLPVPNVTAPVNPSSLAGTFQPGLYTTTINGGNLMPGIYYFTGNGAGVSIGSNQQLSGSGVLLFFTNGASISFASKSTIDLSPPTGGPYAGITLWEDGGGTNPDGSVRQPDANPLQVGPTSDTSGLKGIIYLPKADLAIPGTATFYASNLIADGIVCSGGGGGSVNLGYFSGAGGYIPSTTATLSFTTPPPASANASNPPTIKVTSTNPNLDSVAITVDQASATVCEIPTNTIVGNSTVEGKITILNSGNCIIDVNQPGTSPYFAAHEIQASISVSAG